MYDITHRSVCANLKEVWSKHKINKADVFYNK